MNDKLCDRCLDCSNKVIEIFEIKENFNDFHEYKKQILKILHILSPENYIISDSISNLPYSFLEDICEDCNINSKMNVKRSITLYIKTVLIMKMFKIILKNDCKRKLFENVVFCNTMKRKLIAIQFNKNGNNHMIKYYRCNLIKNDVGNICSFECLNKINEYYKKIFGIPIYLANFDSEQYCERAKLNLNEKIKNHPLVLKS